MGATVSGVDHNWMVSLRTAIRCGAKPTPMVVCYVVLRI